MEADIDEIKINIDKLYKGALTGACLGLSRLIADLPQLIVVALEMVGMARRRRERCQRFSSVVSFEPL